MFIWAWSHPNTYYYDGSDRYAYYGASVFTPVPAGCSVSSYTCNEVDALGVLGASCGDGDSTTLTELSFDTSTGFFKFRSSDISDVKYPIDTTHTFRITAIAGTDSSVQEGIDINLVLSCGIYASDFIWAPTINQAEVRPTARIDYIPGESMPNTRVDPLDPVNDPIYIDPVDCPIELSITWRETYTVYDPSGATIFDNPWEIWLQH